MSSPGNDTSGPVARLERRERVVDAGERIRPRDKLFKLQPAGLIQRNEARDAIEPTIERLRKFGDLQLARVHAASGGIKAVRESGPREADAEKIVVKRKRFGTIPLDDLPHGQWEGQPSGAWAAIPTIALYWCDGHRTLAEVAKLTRLELGPTDFDFVTYFRFLKKHGYVDFARGS